MTTLEERPADSECPGATTGVLHVAVIDRARTSRDALCRALSTGAGVRAVDCGPSAASALPRDGAFDAFLFHVTTPVPGLVAEVKAVAEAHPSAAVIVVAAYVDAEVVAQLHDHGATDVLADDVGLDHVVAAFARSDDPAPRLPVLHTTVAVRADELGITDREIGVLRALSEGLSPQQIAHEAQISVSTVRDHLKHLRHKLECASAVELVVTAHRLGLLPNLNSPLP